MAANATFLCLNEMFPSSWCCPTFCNSLGMNKTSTSVTYLVFINTAELQTAISMPLCTIRQNFNLYFDWSSWEHVRKKANCNNLPVVTAPDTWNKTFNVTMFQLNRTLCYILAALLDTLDRVIRSWLHIAKTKGQTKYSNKGCCQFLCFHARQSLSSYTVWLRWKTTKTLTHLVV